MAALLWWRKREITDGLLDLLVRVVHKIGARAERRVEKELVKLGVNLDAPQLSR